MNKLTIFNIYFGPNLSHRVRNGNTFVHWDKFTDYTMSCY